MHETTTVPPDLGDLAEAAHNENLRRPRVWKPEETCKHTPFTVENANMLLMKSREGVWSLHCFPEHSHTEPTDAFTAETILFRSMATHLRLVAEALDLMAR